MFVCVHTFEQAEHLFLLASSFSPTVEQTSPDAVLFRIDGLKRLIGSPGQIAEEIQRRAADFNLTTLNIAVAQYPDAAILAARNLTGITIISPGEESSYLGELELDVLPLTLDAYETLTLWGIRTLADFARLPENGIAERLGTAGVALWQLAAGIAQRPIRPALPPADYRAFFELDHPVALLEPLLFLFSRLLHDLCGRLETQSLAVGELCLQLTLDGAYEPERALRIPFATREAKPLLKMLQLELEARPPKCAVTGIEITVDPVPPRVLQNHLFLPTAPAPEALELTLEKIRMMVGQQNAGSAELLNTHRPDAWRMLNFAPSKPRLDNPKPSTQLAFRAFRPPLRATVETTNTGIPARLTATGVRGRIVHVAGPWRTSGDWWTTAPWDRDEWDICLSDGALYRAYRQLGVWYVDGSYD